MANLKSNNTGQPKQLKSSPRVGKALFSDMSSRCLSHASKQAVCKKQNLTISLCNLVTHHFIGTAEALKYFATFSNFFKSTSTVPGSGPSQAT